MKNLKFGIIGAGVLGLICMFALPYVDAGPFKLTLWELRKLESGIYMVLAGFAVATAMGVMGVVKAPMLKWQFGVAGAGFLLVLAKLRGQPFEEGAGISGKLMLVAAIAGLGISIFLATKGEEG